MRPVAFLLRLLLCLGLLANGMGVVQATRMQLAHVAQARVADAAAPGDCHEAPGVSTQAAMDSHGTPSQPHAEDGACCDGAACQCICAAQPSLALPVGLALVAASAQGEGRAGVASNHRAPRLPHRIRPPIG